MRFRDVRRAVVRGKRVLVRIDVNVEIDKRGRIRNDLKLKAAVPTVRWILKHGGTVILVSSRGEPKTRDRRLSLRPIAPRLARLVGRPIRFLDVPIGSSKMQASVGRLRPGDIVLLENIRFSAGEKTNDPKLARAIASLADLYVNDAFANSHRSHASMVGVTHYLPAYAGIWLQREVAALTMLTENIKHPYVAVIGGAKISTKLGLVRQLLRQADYVLLGGALANTLLAAQGLAIGASLNEPAMLRAARGLTVANPRLKIPVDVVAAYSLSPQAKKHTSAVGNLDRRDIILDIGPETIALFRAVIATAKTVIWNGPMGRYEIPAFAAGSQAVARAIAKNRGRTIIGGGETDDVAAALGLERRYSFVSTGGGAMLEFLEGKNLPGLKPLLL